MIRACDTCVHRSQVMGSLRCSAHPEPAWFSANWARMDGRGVPTGHLPLIAGSCPAHQAPPPEVPGYLVARVVEACGGGAGGAGGVATVLEVGLTRTEAGLLMRQDTVLFWAGPGPPEKRCVRWHGPGPPRVGQTIFFNLNRAESMAGPVALVAQELNRLGALLDTCDHVAPPETRS